MPTRFTSYYAGLNNLRGWPGGHVAMAACWTLETGLVEAMRGLAPYRNEALSTFRQMLGAMRVITGMRESEKELSGGGILEKRSEFYRHAVHYMTENQHFDVAVHHLTEDDKTTEVTVDPGIMLIVGMLSDMLIEHVTNSPVEIIPEKMLRHAILELRWIKEAAYYSAAAHLCDQFGIAVERDVLRYAAHQVSMGEELLAEWKAQSKYPTGEAMSDGAEIHKWLQSCWNALSLMFNQLKVDFHINLFKKMAEHYDPVVYVHNPNVLPSRHPLVQIDHRSSNVVVGPREIHLGQIILVSNVGVLEADGMLAIDKATTLPIPPELFQLYASARQHGQTFRTYLTPLQLQQLYGFPAIVRLLDQGLSEGPMDSLGFFTVVDSKVTGMGEKSRMIFLSWHMPGAVSNEKAKKPIRDSTIITLRDTPNGLQITSPRHQPTRWYLEKARMAQTADTDMAVLRKTKNTFHVRGILPPLLAIIDDMATWSDLSARVINRSAAIFDDQPEQSFFKVQVEEELHTSIAIINTFAPVIPDYWTRMLLNVVPYQEAFVSIFLPRMLLELAKEVALDLDRFDVATIETMLRKGTWTNEGIERFMLAVLIRLLKLTDVGILPPEPEPKEEKSEEPEEEEPLTDGDQ